MCDKLITSFGSWYQLCCVLIFLSSVLCTLQKPRCAVRFSVGHCSCKILQLRTISLGVLCLRQVRLEFFIPRHVFVIPTLNFRCDFDLSITFRRSSLSFCLLIITLIKSQNLTMREIVAVLSCFPVKPARRLYLYL